MESTGKRMRNGLDRLIPKRRMRLLSYLLLVHCEDRNAVRPDGVKPNAAGAKTKRDNNVKDMM